MGQYVIILTPWYDANQCFWLNYGCTFHLVFSLCSLRTQSMRVSGKKAGRSNLCNIPETLTKETVNMSQGAKQKIWTNICGLVRFGTLVEIAAPWNTVWAGRCPGGGVDVEVTKISLQDIYAEKQRCSEERSTWLSRSKTSVGPRPTIQRTREVRFNDAYQHTHTRDRVLNRIEQKSSTVKIGMDNMPVMEVGNFQSVTKTQTNCA